MLKNNDLFDIYNIYKSFNAYINNKLKNKVKG